MDLASASQEFAQFMWAEKSSADKYRLHSTSPLYPSAREVLLYAPLVAVAIFIVKVVSELLVLQPLCRALLKLKGADLPFQSDILESVYRKHKPGVPDINEVKELSKTTGKSVESVNSWFKQRQASDRNTVKVRGCSESLWRLAMYSFSLFVNLSILREKDWSKQLSLCWEGIPFQEQEESIKLFYIAFEIPLYIVLLFTQVTDGRKAKDMWEMTTHHLLVVLMLSMMYVGNFCRIGMVGLALHDVTDLFLEGSKLASHFRSPVLADVLFAGFSFTWIYARLFKFTTSVVASFVTDGTKVVGQKALYVFGGLLLVLILLNVFWAVKILRVMYRVLWAGKAREQHQREFTDFSTDDDSDSSYLSDAEPLKRHEHED